jgi:hypothetical protein
MTSVRILNGFDITKGNLTYPTIIPCRTGNFIIEMTAAERCTLVHILENKVTNPCLELLIDQGMKCGGHSNPTRDVLTSCTRSR